MRSDLSCAIGAGIINVLTVALLAPLFQGVMRKITARVQSRQGPPVLQPYFDLLKLLGKEDIESGEAPAVQRLAAHLALGTALTLACLVPMGLQIPMDASADAIVLIYLLTVSSVCTLVAGLAAGSTFSLVGASREMMGMMAMEPLLAVAIIVGAIHVHSFRLSAVLSGSVYAAGGFPWSGLIVLVVMTIAFQAFVQRAPFDIPEAETEIMEGPLAEYSGPKLALFKYAQMVRLLVFAGLCVGLFAPWGAGHAFPLGWLLFWGKVACVALVVTLVAATHARFRIDQALRYYAGLLTVSFGALLAAAYGH